MLPDSIDRRRFLARAAAGALVGLPVACVPREPGASPALPPEAEPEPDAPPKPYSGPNVILIRFGGGVRRQETVQFPEKTYCPFVVHELAGKHGVLYRNVNITDDPDIKTSHGEGTLYILTGRYDRYQDVTGQFLGQRFEPPEPTLFEYLRKCYAVPEHQALLVNGEDRIDEEFYSFSNHHSYGVSCRATVLSLYRFKTYLLRQDLENPDLPDAERQVKEKQLREMESKDYRVRDKHVVSDELDRFWAGWRDHYGRSGMVNPRGDRLLTALALRALRELRPKLMMVNYQDPDYVHWGPASFYTRAITVIDEGVRQLYDATQADPEYRDNTYFVVVPDCGRDNSRATAVPYQHHFNSRSARQIFAVVAGPGIRPGRVIDAPQQQIAVTATVGRLMNFPTRRIDPNAGLLTEVFA